MAKYRHARRRPIPNVDVNAASSSFPPHCGVDVHTYVGAICVVCHMLYPRIPDQTGLDWKHCASWGCDALMRRGKTGVGSNGKTRGGHV